MADAAIAAEQGAESDLAALSNLPMGKTPEPTEARKQPSGRRRINTALLHSAIVGQALYPEPSLQEECIGCWLSDRRRPK